MSAAIAWSAPAPSLDKPDRDHLDRLDRYKTQIINPEARPDERRNWADALIDEANRVRSKPSWDTVEQMLRFSQTPAVQQAMCAAIAGLPGTERERLPARLAAPLLDLLGSETDALAATAAQALAEFKDGDIPAQLAEIVANPTATLSKRQAAVHALAPNVHRRAVAAALIGLVDLDELEIRKSVVAALEPAAAKAVGSDPARWKSWWAEKSRLSEAAWLADQLAINRDRVHRLHQQLEVQVAGAERQQTLLRESLRKFQREVFMMLPAEKREEKLVAWLKDSQADVRLTALELIKGRIADEGKKPDGAVLSAMLPLLRDEVPEVRRQVLSIVQALNDPAITSEVLAQFPLEKDPQTRVAIIRAIGRLGGAEAVAPLVGEIASASASDELVREAAAALGQVTSQINDVTAFALAVKPLKKRYQEVKESDHELRAALLTAMAGIGDKAFAPEFHGALNADSAPVVRAAVEGVRAIGDVDKLSQLRGLTSATDPLVRVAAIEAVGQLGRDSADLECLAARIDPSKESNERAREAAWRWFREMAGNRSNQDCMQVAELLHDVPDREIAYLQEQADRLLAANDDNTNIDAVQQRLAKLMEDKGRFLEALPHLRQLFDRFKAGKNPEAPDLGLRLLAASLRASTDTDLVALVAELNTLDAGDDEVPTRVMGTIKAYLESPALLTDVVHARLVLKKLRQIPSESMDVTWKATLDAAALRLTRGDKEKTPPLPTAP